MGYYADGRLQSVYGLTYTYAPNSHLIAGVAAPGWNYRWQRTYEAKRDLVESSDTLNNTGGYYARFVIARDSLGRVEKSTRTQGIFSSYGALGIEANYEYDDLSQVKRDWTALTGTSAPPAARDNRFAYDAFGNRKSVQQGTGSAVSTQPNELNQLKSINGVVANYDPDGNLTEDALWSYTYDAENRLIGQENTSAAIQAERVAAAAARKLEYKYDYLGRRVSKTVYTYNSVSRTYGTQTISRRVFLYDGWNLIREFDQTVATNSLAPVANHVWGLDLSGTAQGAGGVGGLLFSYDYASGKVLQPIYDQNGNVHGMVDQFGATVVRYEFDAFGQTVVEDSTLAAANPFRFSTKYHDVETKLLYYGLRYYSPSMGRFINRDPIDEAGGINLYAFVRNNAVNAWDYLGMWGEEIIGMDGGTHPGPKQVFQFLNNIQDVSGIRASAREQLEEEELRREKTLNDLQKLAGENERLARGETVRVTDANGKEQTFLPGEKIALSGSGKLVALAPENAGNESLAFGTGLVATRGSSSVIQGVAVAGGVGASGGALVAGPTVVMVGGMIYLANVPPEQMAAAQSVVGSGALPRTQSTTSALPVPSNPFVSVSYAPGSVYVVRGGITTPQQLQNGVADHQSVPGLSGFSVQSFPNMTVDQLALAGRFPHNTISYTTAGELALVGVRVVPSPGGGKHATAVTPNPLPIDLATLISQQFKQKPNPTPAGGSGGTGRRN